MLILFIALASSACAISKKENDRAEKQIKAETISDNILLNDSISSAHLKYFEDRAIQKLIDFYDYLNMLGHENYNETIIKEVRSSAENLFFDIRQDIAPYKTSNDEMIKRTIDELLKENIGENALPELDILNVEITENLKIVNGSYFIGQLIFDIRDKEAALIITKKGQFSLRKMEKKFGDENLKIWEVFLDNIY